MRTLSRYCNYVQLQLRVFSARFRDVGYMKGTVPLILVPS
jgi:hypothetical protein